MNYEDAVGPMMLRGEGKKKREEKETPGVEICSFTSMIPDFYITVEMPLPIGDANGLSGRLSPWLLLQGLQEKPK